MQWQEGFHKKGVFMFSCRFSITLIAFLLLPSVLHAQSQTPTANGPRSQYGWLEGTITITGGSPVVERDFTTGKQIKLTKHGGGAFIVQSDPSMGGLYSNHTLKPGLYDVSVSTGYYSNTGSTAYRPQRILGVLIKLGQRTILNIVMPQGETLEETGTPSVVSAPATNVTDELAKMQKQIDDLKQQVAALLKATAPAAVQSTPAKL